MKNTNRYSYVDQSINYVECHDNATTFDKFAISNGDEPLETRKKRQLMLRLFYHMEFLLFIVVKSSIVVKMDLEIRIIH